MRHTNFEKIKNMSIDELANLFSKWTTTGACNDFGITTSRKCDGNCQVCLKEWLESEVENGRI